MTPEMPSPQPPVAGPGRMPIAGCALMVPIPLLAGLL
jgi:hypothetical protein